MAFLTPEQVQNIGLKFAGEHVKISDKAVFYNPSNISVGNYSRIDDFCILSAGDGGIKIGEYVHIAVFASLIGKGEIKLEDYSGISARVSLYSSSDDYSGEFLTNPTVPVHFTNVKHGPVLIGKHVIVGANSVVLPSVKIGEGSAVGAFSLVADNIPSYVIVAGVPARTIKPRSKKIFELEKQHRDQKE